MERQNVRSSRDYNSPKKPHLSIVDEARPPPLAHSPADSPVTEFSVHGRGDHAVALAVAQESRFVARRRSRCHPYRRRRRRRPPPRDIEAAYRLRTARRALRATVRRPDVT